MHDHVGVVADSDKALDVEGEKMRGEMTIEGTTARRVPATKTDRI